MLPWFILTTDRQETDLRAFNTSSRSSKLPYDIGLRQLYELRYF